MRKTISSIRIIALGYAVVVILGSLLLITPFASADGNSADLLTAVFTAVSASCVTGLVVVNTATQWSFFGQIVILVLIQIGGLGFMTIATGFTMLLKKRLGLRQRQMMIESISVESIGGIAHLTRRIILGTLLFEGTGAILLSTVFVRDFGLKGIWYAVFHSISAFCNAGFDILGTDVPYCSFTGYTDNITVNLTICFLILIGGIGFLVWDDLLKNKFKFKKYSFHTKIVLVMTLLLTVVSTLLFMIFEKDYTNSDAGLKQTVLASLFDNVTARTAGFNTVDTASLSPASKILTIILMFIGGSPGSTAGGIKTTTVAVIAVSTFNGIRRRESTGIFGRRFEKDAIYKASSVVFTNLMLAVFGLVAILAIQPSLDLSDMLFEVFSAIGTVGMSTGITRELLPASQIIIAFLMFSGRVGSVSFALALMEKRSSPPVKNPREKITIG